MTVEQQSLKKYIQSLIKMRVEYQNQLDAWECNKSMCLYYLNELSMLNEHLGYMIKQIEVQSYYKIELDDN